MGNVGGAKHAAPKHARGAQHAKHAKYTKRSNGMFYAAGAVFVAAALAVGVFAVPAFSAPQSVSTSGEAVGAVVAESTEAAKAPEPQVVQADAGKDEAAEPAQPADPGSGGGAVAVQQAAAETPTSAPVSESTEQAPEAPAPESSEIAENAEPAQQESAVQDADEGAEEAATDQAEATTSAVEGDFEAELPAAEQQGQAASAGSPNEVLANKALELQAQSGEGEIAFYQSLLEDGATIDEQTAEQLAKNPVSYAANVKQMLQEGVLDSGCEIFSLAIALDSMGVKVDPVEIADEYLDFEGGIEEGGYMGSPYYGGGGFPSAIAKAANGYLEDAGLKYRAHDLTGNSLQAIVGLVDRGYPVLVWVTIDYEEPFLYNDMTDVAQWYANEHCVVMYGMKDGKVQISDPLEGFVELEVSEFAELYELCGSMALFVR